MKLLFARRLIACVLFLAMPLLSSCSRTVIGGYSDSPDSRFRVYGRVHGAYGRSFLETTPKTVSITIVEKSGEKVLFRKQFRVIGGYLKWEPTWRADDTLVIEIVEQNGVSKTNQTKWMTTKTFRLNADQTKFMDEAASNE